MRDDCPNASCAISPVNSAANEPIVHHQRQMIFVVYRMRFVFGKMADVISSIEYKMSNAIGKCTMIG